MVYVFLADGFEETEAIAPIDLLRRANLEVVTVAVSENNEKFSVMGSRNITIIADINIAAIEPNLCGGNNNKIEMIVLPGGGVGVQNLEASDKVKSFINFCVQNNIFIGAICAAPSIPAKMGLLNGKTAISYPSFQKYLTENGAEISDESVCADGIFITAEAAGASVEFGLRLVEALKGKAESEKIAGDIRFELKKG